MNLFNLHTHSTFCDGKAEPEEYVKKAIQLGFHTLGFSSHSPLPFENYFSLKEENKEKYISTIQNLKEKYKTEITINLSLEFDFIPGISSSFEDVRNSMNLDYAIGGVHLVKNEHKHGLWFIDGPLPEKYDQGLEKIFNGHARKGVEAYYNQILEMVATQKPDIIAHFDKIKMHNKDRYFSEEEAWYKDIVWKVLKFIARSNSIIEINTRGVYKKKSSSLFPGTAIMEQIHHLKIPITLSSDAHLPDELDGHYMESIDILKDIGFNELKYFDGKVKKTQNI